ncbi:TetR/AcrR family transcriptional regulator [Amycolatopsis suaedae]|uniref:TetR/AcrR family transcriptional regulator n=1 Tax=Amycolatopsis suaedae TaxID=2510978 RepID=A0A4Q7J248_9PSEU|nr:TetR/AcrR family transcriptional regulator [Amycolatopsis suaedae]RZQ60818.1 TetR/AcrR family transcriptional regulator [Amycolatopsis suaedae]
MPRPRKFDEESAVAAAMAAFRATGYESTSTEDLCTATGLGRSSIYNTFASKHDLFTRSLAHYIDTVTTRQIAMLESEAPAREKVWALLDEVVADETGDRLGCLVVNTSIELAPRDPVVAELLRKDYERRIGAMTQLFRRAQRDGEIAPDRDPEALAHFLSASISGIRVAARTGAGRGALKDIAATALAAL